jgi:hypothetical protein
MLDGINRVFVFLRGLFSAIFNLRFYDSVRLGMLLVGLFVLGILLRYLVSHVR